MGEDELENRRAGKDGGKGGGGDFETSDSETGDGKGDNPKAGDFKAETPRSSTAGPVTGARVQGRTGM